VEANLTQEKKNQFIIISSIQIRLILYKVRVIVFTKEQ